MSGRPRGEVIRHDEVGVYHVWSRCVRRARLCGIDPVTGKNYEHRKQWILDRLEQFASIFAIDACVFAILSSHFHLLVRNRPDLAAQWSDEEVVRRWWQLFPERRDQNGNPEPPTDLEIKSLLANPETVAKCRRNLSNISVFMQYLNQDIARRANLEDGTTGHFFGDRFGCRSLLDERAILICALYIDLNELRAQLALAPEDAEFSSAYLRILRKLRRQIRDAELAAGIPESKVIAEDDPGEWLCPIDEQECLPLLGPPGAESVEISRRQLEGKGEPGANSKPFNPGDVRKTWRHGILGMHLDDYLKFLDWHARRIVSGKAGVMDPSLPPIMERLGITADQLIQAVDNFDTWFHGAVGSPESLTDEAARRGRRWLQGIGPSRLVFS